MSEMRVVVEGGYDPVTGNTITPLPVSVVTSGGNGSVPSVRTGMTTAGQTLSNANGGSFGTTIDAGSAVSNWSAFIGVPGGITSGTLTIEFSYDGAVYFNSGTNISITAPGGYFIASTGKPSRYARATLTGVVGSPQLNCWLIGAG